MQTTTGASDWLAAISTRLQRYWPTIDPTTIDGLALDLWCGERPRAMLPEMAAEEWLRPVVPRT